MYGYDHGVATVPDTVTDLYVKNGNKGDKMVHIMNTIVGHYPGNFYAKPSVVQLTSELNVGNNTPSTRDVENLWIPPRRVLTSNNDHTQYVTTNSVAFAPTYNDPIVGDNCLFLLDTLDITEQLTYTLAGNGNKNYVPRDTQQPMTVEDMTTPVSNGDPNAMKPGAAVSTTAVIDSSYVEDDYGGVALVSWSAGAKDDVRLKTNLLRKGMGARMELVGGEYVVSRLGHGYEVGDELFAVDPQCVEIGRVVENVAGGSTAAAISQRDDILELSVSDVNDLKKQGPVYATPPIYLTTVTADMLGGSDTIPLDGGGLLSDEILGDLVDLTSYELALADNVDAMDESKLVDTDIQVVNTDEDATATVKITSSELNALLALL